MKKYLFLLLLIASTLAQAQARRLAGYDTLTGAPGKIYKDTVKVIVCIGCHFAKGLYSDTITLTGSGAAGIDDVLADLQQLTTDRKIRGGNHVLTMDSMQLKFTNPSDPAILFDPFPTATPSAKYLLRAHTASATNNGSFEMLLDNNSNGGPPDDNIFVWGWNIDSRTDPTLPSWTGRMEYKYTGSFYENHIQWANPGGSRTYRLMSQTFVDHGSLTDDLSTTFFKGTGFEFRPLRNDQAFFSFSNSNVNDNSELDLVNTAGDLGFRVIADAVNQQIRLSTSSGTPINTKPFIFQNFSSITFGSIAAIIPGNNTLLIDRIQPAGASVSNLSFDVGVNDMSFSYMAHSNGANAPLWYEYFSAGSGEWTQSFRVNGGYYWQVQTHNDAGAATSTPLRIDPGFATFQVPVYTPASTTTSAGLRVLEGVVPSSPVNGDVYQDGTHGYMRIGGVWKQLD